MTPRGDSATTTETDDKSIRNAPHGLQFVQVETLGKLGLLIVLVLFVVIVALAFFTGRTDGLGQARAENLATQMRTLNARVEVIQWEFDKASAQLIEKGLITPPE